MSQSLEFRPVDAAAAVRATELAGIVNFRDFGGHPTQDGARVVRGRLYRSGHHATAEEADLRHLADVDLAVLVDLRRPGERARLPARRPHPFRAHVIEHEGPGEEAVPPHLAVLATPGVTDRQVLEQMVVGYRGYAFDPAYVQMYRRYFRALAGADGAVLIHCHAGKDRTGVLAAMTLHVLGVSREVIAADYLLSNDHSRIDERLPQLLADYRRDRGTDISEAALRQLMRVEPDYLDAFFEAVGEAHGDLDSYLADVVDVGAEQRSAIRATFLEG